MGNDNPTPEQYKSVLPKDYSVVEFPKVKSSFEMMMEGFTGSSEETLLKRIFKSRSLSEAERIIRDFEAHNGVKTYARMPYNYSFSY